MTNHKTMKIILPKEDSDFNKAAVKELNQVAIPQGMEVCNINVYGFPTVLVPEQIAASNSMNNHIKEFICGTQKLGDKIVCKIVISSRTQIKHLS